MNDRRTIIIAGIAGATVLAVVVAVLLIPRRVVVEVQQPDGTRVELPTDAGDRWREAQETIRKGREAREKMEAEWRRKAEEDAAKAKQRTPEEEAELQRDLADWRTKFDAMEPEDRRAMIERLSPEERAAIYPDGVPE